MDPNQQPIHHYGDHPPSYSDIMSTGTAPTLTHEAISVTTSTMPAAGTEHRPIMPMPYDGIAANSSAVPVHTFQPASAFGFVGQSSAAQPATDGYHQHKAQPQPDAGYPQQPPPTGGYVVTQPMLATNAPIGYGTMMGGGVAVPPTTAHVTHHTIIVDDLRVVGGCPACRIGVLEENYPCCALCCAIVFFPAGILCCLCMRNRRCSHCHTEF